MTAILNACQRFGKAIVDKATSPSISLTDDDQGNLQSAAEFIKVAGVVCTIGMAFFFAILPNTVTFTLAGSTAFFGLVEFRRFADNALEILKNQTFTIDKSFFSKLGKGTFVIQPLLNICAHQRLHQQK